jgi:hypothetical protein
MLRWWSPWVMAPSSGFSDLDLKAAPGKYRLDDFVGNVDKRLPVGSIGLMRWRHQV